MQTEDLSGTMSTAAAEILETMFFVSPEPVEAPSGWNTPTISAHIDFQGERSGHFDLTLDQALAAALAAGFLGEFDPDAVSEEQTTQVTCELANMLCGVTLSHLAPSGTFELGVPMPCAYVPEACAAPAIDPVVCWLNSEEKLLRLELTWTSGAKHPA